MAHAAIDQRHAYGGIDNALDSHRDNLLDTLTEYGVRSGYWIEQAREAFDEAAAGAHKAAEQEDRRNPPEVARTARVTPTTLLEDQPRSFVVPETVPARNIKQRMADLITDLS